MRTKLDLGRKKNKEGKEKRVKVSAKNVIFQDIFSSQTLILAKHHVHSWGCHVNKQPPQNKEKRENR
jgi:hypothetical protein